MIAAASSIRSVQHVCLSDEAFHRFKILMHRHLLVFFCVGFRRPREHEERSCLSCSQRVGKFQDKIVMLLAGSLSSLPRCLMCLALPFSGDQRKFRL
jgi:hypothetical protein